MLNVYGTNVRVSPSDDTKQGLSNLQKVCLDFEGTCCMRYGSFHKIMQLVLATFCEGICVVADQVD